MLLNRDIEGVVANVYTRHRLRAGNADVTCVRTSSVKAVRALDVPDVDCSTTPPRRMTPPTPLNPPPLTSSPITYRAQSLRSYNYCHKWLTTALRAYLLICTSLIYLARRVRALGSIPGVGPTILLKLKYLDLIAI